jgi:hypothetical protein
MKPLPWRAKLRLFAFLQSAIATRHAAGFIAAIAANPRRARLGFWPMAFPAVTMVAPMVRRIVVRLVRSSR